MYSDRDRAKNRMLREQVDSLDIEK